MHFLLRLLLVPLAGMFIWVARLAKEAYQQVPPASAAGAITQRAKWLAPLPKASPAPGIPGTTLLWYQPTTGPVPAYALPFWRGASY